jgi:potassium-dependent mechanosensitive channel
MMPRACVLAAFCCFFATMQAGSGHLPGADDVRAASSNAPAASTISSLESRIQGLRENKDLDAERRDELIDIYTKAIAQSRKGDEFTAKGAEWVKKTETAPADIERLKAETARSAESSAAGIPSAASIGGDLTKMQQALTRAEAERDHRRQELEELSDENERRSDRRREIAEREEEIDTELRDVQEALDRDRDEDDDLALAQQTLAQEQRRALLAEQEMHRQELLAFEATAELVTAQRDLTATRLQIAEEQLDAWQKGVNDLRRSEADRHLAETQRKAELVHPALRPIALANVELAAARRDIALRIEETLAESEAATTRLDELREQFEKVTERAKRIGFTDAIGLILRKHRDTLSVIDESLRNKRARAASVSQMSILVADYEEQRVQLADSNSRVKKEMARLRGGIPAGEAATVEAELRDLFATQRSGLDALIRDTTRYVEELMELESVERQLVTCVREFAAFSDEHILWIRSTGFPQPADADRLVAAAGWMVRPAHWEKGGRILMEDARAHIPLYASIGIVFAGLAIGPWYLRRRAGTSLNRLLKKGDRHPLITRKCAENQNAPESVPVFQQPVDRLQTGAAMARFMVAVVATAWWPALIAFAGLRLSASASADEFVTVLGRSLTGVALPWFLAGCLCRLSKREGSAAVLFGGSDLRTPPLHRMLVPASFMAIPLMLVLLMSEAQLADGPRNTLGRLAFVLLMGLFSEVTRRLWRGAEIRADRESSDESGSWPWRGIPVVRLATVALPIGFAAASVAGYHDTALQLAKRTVETAAFVVAVLSLRSLCSRWVERGRQSLPADLLVDETDSAVFDESQVQSAAAAAESMDGGGKPAALSAQVQRLLRLASVVVLLGGTLAIWSAVFPASKLLRSVEVWPRPVHLVDPEMAAEDAVKIVTLAGLLAAIGIVIVTFAAARNARGALELTLLRHVRLDAGARYAVAAICRYLIALVGLLAACSSLGIGASQLNWLVAAMTVGLGFGLQEIFANFVSGLILLFERPVRIGDIVSVEGVTGTVSRIRIRATTITDGDMRELIVPNKELITGRVINWTLSNTVARMTISVRTAHGVDPDKARNLLLAVATQHPLVLKQPPAHALFDEFSDKTQNFTLRVFMANCEVYPQLRHELLTGIQRAFRQAGIGLNSSDAASLPIPVLPQEQRAA